MVKTERADREAKAIAELKDRGYTNEKKQNRHGETLSGWWCDDVFLHKCPIKALNEANGN